MLRVYIEHCWKWTCPQCGKVSYSDGALVEEPPEERAASIRLAYGIDPFEAVPDELREARMYACPQTVACQCGAMYDTDESLVTDAPSQPPGDEE